MIIYEVNLTIQSKIYPEFLSWLKTHMQEMLGFPGFTKAILLKPESDERLEQELLTVQYQLEHQRDLDRYLTEFAPKMREAGIKRFQNQFSAERRVLKLLS